MQFVVGLLMCVFVPCEVAKKLFLPTNHFLLLILSYSVLNTVNGFDVRKASACYNSAKQSV